MLNLLSNIYRYNTVSSAFIKQCLLQALWTLNIHIGKQGDGFPTSCNIRMKIVVDGTVMEYVSNSEYFGSL